MQKFTVFTVILTVLVVVVVSEIMVNDYLPSSETKANDDNMTLTLPDNLDLNNTIQTNVLGADLDFNQIEEVDKDDPSVVIDLGINEPVLSEGENESDLIDFEDFDNSPSVTSKYAPNVYLREEQLVSSGFVGAYIEKGNPAAKLYKFIDLASVRGISMEQNLIRTESELLAKVYVIRPGVELEVADLYKTIKDKGAVGLNVEVNETNQYGQSSFYINDGTRANTVFLTVRIGGVVYGFSYPQAYHAQIKNLIQLIEWELG